MFRIGEISPSFIPQLVIFNNYINYAWTVEISVRQLQLHRATLTVIKFNSH